MTMFNFNLKDAPGLKLGRIRYDRRRDDCSGRTGESKQC